MESRMESFRGQIPLKVVLPIPSFQLQKKIGPW